MQDNIPFDKLPTVDFLRILARDLEAEVRAADAGDPLTVWKLHIDVARRLAKELHKLGGA